MIDEPAAPAAPAPAAPAPIDPRAGEVPRLPRGPLIRLSGPHVFRIGMIVILLVAVLGLRKPCADGMAGFVGSFEPPPDAGPAATPALELERLTEDEIRRRFPGGDDAGPAADASTR